MHRCTTWVHLTDTNKVWPPALRLNYQKQSEFVPVLLWLNEDRWYLSHPVQCLLDCYRLQYTSSLHKINLVRAGQEFHWQWFRTWTAICIAWSQDSWLVWGDLTFDFLLCWSIPLETPMASGSLPALLWFNWSFVCCFELNGFHFEIELITDTTTPTLVQRYKNIYLHRLGKINVPYLPNLSIAP